MKKDSESIITTVKGKKLGKLKSTPEITLEMIEDKTNELCEMIEKFQGNKSAAAATTCMQVVIWGAYNLFDALGILSEVAMAYRDLWHEAPGEGEEE
jgi:hypothetical protein